MRPNTFLRLVQEEAGLRSLDEAKTATEIVFHLLRYRMTDEEADDVVAQLPRELAGVWQGGQGWVGKLLAEFKPHNKLNRKTFIEQVEARKTDLPASGEKITLAVFYALQNQISAGEAKDISDQLPYDLRELWESVRPLSRVAGGGGGESEELIDISGEFRGKGDFGDTTV
jgi:uncharacterized protein (DUF2267 family)